MPCCTSNSADARSDVADEYEDIIEFAEDCERSHRDYLAEFKEKVYPIFEPYGFTFADAYNQWTLNKIHTVLDEIARHLSGDYSD